MKYFLVLSFIAPLVYGQSEFLDRGVFGFAAGYTYSANSKLNGSGAAAGFSLDGVFDIAIEYAHSTYGNNRLEKVESEGVLFYGAYNIKRKNSNLKVMLGYLSTYASAFYSSGHIKGPVAGFQFSTSVFNGIALALRPGIGFTYGFVSKDDESTFATNTGSLSATFDVVLKSIPELNIIFSPSISKDISVSNLPVMFGISASFLIKFNPNDSVAKQ